MLRSYHFLLGPLVAFVAVGVLIGLSRWTFGPARPTRPRRRNEGRPDYGLLVRVATVGRRDHAEAVRDMLASVGIRATLAPAEPSIDCPRGGFHLLVFPDVEARARNLLARSDR